MYPQSIKNLLKAFKRLPSVGEHTAERYVFHLLNSGKKETTELMLALKELVETIKSCEVCWNFSDTSPCTICSDTKRDHSIITVVAEPPDIAAINGTGAFNGVYHVLRGVIETESVDGLADLKIKELFTRLEDKTVKEIILALNPDLPGETTMLFLEKEIAARAPHVTVSRLARGLPLGADLRYADDITLGSAIKHRTTR